MLMGWPLLWFATIVSAGMGVGFIWLRNRGSLAGIRGMRIMFGLGVLYALGFPVMIALIVSFWRAWSEGQQVLAILSMGACSGFGTISLQHAFLERGSLRP